METGQQYKAVPHAIFPCVTETGWAVCKGCGKWMHFFTPAIPSHQKRWRKHALCQVESMQTNEVHKPAASVELVPHARRHDPRHFARHDAVLLKVCLLACNERVLCSGIVWHNHYEVYTVRSGNLKSPSHRRAVAQVARPTCLSCRRRIGRPPKVVSNDKGIAAGFSCCWPSRRAMVHVEANEVVAIAQRRKIHPCNREIRPVCRHLVVLGSTSKLRRFGRSRAKESKSDQPARAPSVRGERR